MFVPPNVAERLLHARFNNMFLPTVTNRQTQIDLLIDIKNLIHHRFENVPPPHSFRLTGTEQIQFFEGSI